MPDNEFDVLLIGGPADGRRVSGVSSSPLLLEACVGLDKLPLFSPLAPRFESVVYRLERIACDKDIIKVFVFSGITPHEAILRLIERYPAEEK